MAKRNEHELAAARRAQGMDPEIRKRTNAHVLTANLPTGSRYAINWEDLISFVLLRITEDEDAAFYARSRGDSGELEYMGQWFGAVEHARRWTPERVLVECMARREMITAYLAMPNSNSMRVVIRAFAASYRTHPDYSEGWAP